MNMRTITFYSYKGGTGRSLLLINTAYYLASKGCKVVVLDLDLEAPGLHHKYDLKAHTNIASATAIQQNWGQPRDQEVVLGVIDLLLKWQEWEGFDLQLFSLNDVSQIPIKGKDLIIVATVNDVLHFRIFDGVGKEVVHTDDGTLTEQAPQIKDLKKQLECLWPPRELSWIAKRKVITAVRSIVGQNQCEGTDSINNLISMGDYIEDYVHDVTPKEVKDKDVDGNIYLLPAGAAPSYDYSAKLDELNWERLNGVTKDGSTRINLLVKTLGCDPR